MKGTLKTYKKTTWTGVSAVDKSGRQIKIMMSRKDAEDWMRRTNKRVVKILTVRELRELE